MVVKFYLTSLRKTPWQYTYVLYQHQNSVGVFVFSIRNTAPAFYEYLDSNFSYQLFTFFFAPFEDPRGRKEQTMVNVFPSFED